jgi:hypothetical protein
LANAGVAVGVDVARFKSAFGSPAVQVSGAAAPSPNEPAGAGAAAGAAPVPGGSGSFSDQRTITAPPSASALPPEFGQAASIAPVPAAAPPAPAAPLPRIALPVTRTPDRLTAGGALWRIAVAIVGGVLAGLLHARRSAIGDQWSRVRASLPLP